MTNSTLVAFLLALLGDGGDDGGANPLPPGSPPTLKFQGPWFQTQVTLSASIGLVSFLLFSYCRTRWPLLFAPRTKLKGFSPHEAHAHQAFFGWIMPTIRTSEFTVLQIVGLDAAVLLNFFKMSFYLFSVCSLFAATILMPMNWTHNKDLFGDSDGDSDGDGTDAPWFNYRLVKSEDPPLNRTEPPDWLDLISDANTYLSVHLMFTYLFTLLALYFIYKNYRRFIRSRQLFSLELVHSIQARTVMVTNLPPRMRSERLVAEYFESMDLAVESVTLCREVGSLNTLLDKRTKALLKLEEAWTGYVGNPSTVEEYDPERTGGVLIDTDPEGGHSTQKLVVPHRPRPTVRPSCFGSKIDALEYLERQFKDADERVKKKRRTGKFKSTGAAFVTFEKMSSAQIAVQAAHSSNPNELLTYPAPEPRDIVWGNMTSSIRSMQFREVLVLAMMGLLLFFWVLPITALAGLLSVKEIKKTLPWLGRLIESNEKVRAIVQNSLPSAAMITLNAMLPFMLEALTYVQGYKARSWIEYSLLKKYFLFLLINVVFIFLFATTYLQLVLDLANSPAKFPEKLAQALLAGRARNFFLSYIILQGFGIMPLQLLNLGVIIPRFFYRAFLTRTPRDFAELNAPPMINYGVVYPQAILMFVITMLYSVVQPLIVIFGAIYFGVSYVVYKYKLLFVFYKPYESQGQAWPITFIRLIWGVVMFLVFMIGIFTLRESFVLSFLLLPLLIGTLTWSWYIHHALRPLSKCVSLSSIYEVQRGENIAVVEELRAGHPVTWGQSSLNRRRYAQNDDTLYVAPEDERTDYSQPPMANWYSGVLNTGKRRYGHPALNGVLPEPWLPLKKGQALSNNVGNGARSNGSINNGTAVVLTLRKRQPSTSGRRSRRTSQRKSDWDGTSAAVTTTTSVDPSTVIDPWQDPASASAVASTSTSTRRRQADRHHRPARTRTLAHRLSYDPASGVIMLPDEAAWLDSEEEEDEVGDSDEAVGGSEGEDYGTELDRSVASLGGGDGDGDGEVGVGGLLAGTGEGGGGVGGLGSQVRVPQVPGRGSVVSTPTRTSRYGTYFHHPEKRKQTIPGEFPFR